MKQALLCALFACVVATSASCADQAVQAASASSTTAEVLSQDTPRTTFDGHGFIVPAGWSIRREGAATIMTAPEAGSRIALVDVAATDADAAIAAAWSIYDAKAKWSLEVASDRPVRGGWDQIRGYQYRTPVDAQRVVTAVARRHGRRWNVSIRDMALAVDSKRMSQLELMFSRLHPKGYVAESFAGRRAAKLDSKRINAFREYVEFARKQFEVPGVAIGIVQNGKIVLAEGFGVRALGQPDKVDADTVFMVASITKPLTTLMLAKLVEAGKFGWETPVSDVLPGFKLGDAATTRQVLIKHLVCACTGLPRQDMEWMLDGERYTPASIVALLATMQPTSGFGELHQYSNLLAGAAGYVGAHALHPDMELGAAYDSAMQSLVFDPLGMRSTTFDFARAQQGNHAQPHDLDSSGLTVRADIAPSHMTIPSRPDGGAWSNVRDLLRYLQMELRDGSLPNGKRYIAKAPLLARRAQQVATGADTGYGMGLRIDRSLGTPIFHHGGSGFGGRAEMLWLPEHQVGVVILSNAGVGGIRGLIQRRLMELLFDGHREAEPNAPILAQMFKDTAAAERKTLTIPPEPKRVAQLAAHYRNAALGDIQVRHDADSIWFDFGGWKSEVATRRDDEGHTSFVTTSASVQGFEFIVGNKDEKRSLMLRDEQHEYVFDAVK